MEYWEIENSRDNTTSVFVRTQGTASVATSSHEVAPGEIYPLFLDHENGNKHGVSLIAETSDTLVMVRKTYFRSRLRFDLAKFAGAVAAAISTSFWTRISATAIQLSGGLTAARFDSTRPKTAGADWTAQNDQGNNSFVANDGANGGTDVRGDGTGNAALLSSDDTDFVAMGTGRLNITRASTQLIDLVDNLYAHRVSTAPVIFTSGDLTTEIHRFNSTARIRRMTASGAAASQAMDQSEWIIENGQVIAAGDLVELTAAASTVRAEQVGSTGIVGVCVSGGTGDAGGTVKALVQEWGMLNGTLVADNAGVTAGERAFGGATDVNQIASQATIEGTFARLLETGASGVAVDGFLNGTH